jgi:hypothetical protein
MRRFYKSTSLFAAIIGIVVFGSNVHAAKSTYVGQNVIDSLVDRAFYILNGAGDPASGMTQEEAVASAKKIAVTLRKIAEYDQNRKYILFKTGELENQIYLEEEGLLMEKEKYRQKSANDLIPLFNAELGKQRPDFKDLWSIQKQMAGIDANMAIDVENSIRKRAFALAKEVPYFFETKLEDGKIDDARTELAYCRVNNDYLGLSPSRYASLEAKLNSKVNADDDREQVIKGLERFKTALKTNNLNNARMEDRFLGEKIKALRKNIMPYEWVRLNKDYELFTSKYERKTDSLCDVAIALLHNKGPYAASAFLDTMRTIGMTIEKVNRIDRMILETVVAEKQHTQALAAAESTPLVAGDTGTEEKSDPMLTDLMASARKRTQEKKDSQALARKDRGRTTQIEEVRKDRLRVAFELQQMRNQDAKKTENSAALQELVEIYTCIEKHNPKDALQRFTTSKELLRKNLPAEDYNKVAEVVLAGDGAAGKKLDKTH